MVSAVILCFFTAKSAAVLAASLATAWVCIFGWQPLEVDNPKSRLASNDVVFDIANQGDVEGPYAKSMDFTPVMATQLFNLESSFPLTGLVEGAQEFTLGTPSRQKSELDLFTF